MFPLDFIKEEGVFVDVRSPIEFKHATLPKAINIPLFSDFERAEIGKIYKSLGKEKAIDRGLEFAGPKLSSYVKEARLLSLPLNIFCARGGMRSQCLHWLFTFAGLKASVLKGGYKEFRGLILQTLELPLNLIVIGGKTGCGKTAYLRSLKNSQVLDLEEIARHRGSAYGNLGQEEQPSCEQFENEIGMKLLKFDLAKPIYIENESRMIGFCKIPDPLFKQMKTSPIQFLDLPKEERIENLLKDYGSYPPERLIEKTFRLEKKLGSLKTKEVVQKIEKGELREAIALLLDYYDKTYMYKK